MSGECFVDTNIFIYAAAGAADAPAKWRIAHDLLERPNLCVSAQVLAEFYVNTRRKTPLPKEQITGWLEQLSMLPCAPVDRELVLEGIEASQRYQVSYWDGAIIAAAERQGAKTLYTEDLNHDQTYGSVRAVNPFL